MVEGQKLKCDHLTLLLLNRNHKGRIFGELLKLLFFCLSFSLLNFNKFSLLLWNLLLRLGHLISKYLHLNRVLLHRLIWLFAHLIEWFLFLQLVCYLPFQIIINQNLNTKIIKHDYIFLGWISFQKECFI